jgi:hypothetical protein
VSRFRNSGAAVLVALCSGCSVAPPSGPRSLAAAAELAGAVPEALVPFLGEHFGQLVIHGGGGRPPVAMALEVAATADPERLRWRIRYGEGEAAQDRDYRLVIESVADGRYRIDEQNGIELPAFLIDGELVSVFTVQETALVVRYRAVPDGVEFALESFSRRAPTDVPDGAVPSSHGVRGISTVQSHRAKLRRR